MRHLNGNVARMVVALLMLAAPAFAQSTIESLSPIPTFPLPDPGSVTQHLWTTQGCLTPGACDYKISPTQLGYIFQGTTPPLTPFINQLWWDTSQSPSTLRSWNGTSWGAPGGIGVVNVQSFGVRGDGSDQTTNLTAAINATAGHGCLFFPTPSVGYEVNTPTSPIILPSGTCLEGDGGGSRIFAASTSRVPMFQLAPLGIAIIRDMTFDGNLSSGATVSSALQTDPNTGTTGLVINDVTFTNVGTTLGNASGSGAPLPVGTQIPAALSIVSSGTASQNASVENSYFLNNGTSINPVDGLWAFNISNFSFTRNLLKNNARGGMLCKDLCTQGVIDSNILVGNGSIDGNLQGYSNNNSDITISKNLSVASGNNGIHFGGQRISYIANHVIGPAFDGIDTVSAKPMGPNFTYGPGTVSVTTGSATVTGSGTSWFNFCADFQKGFNTLDATRIEFLATPGATANIKSIDSNTQITLGTTWPGGTVSNSNYIIWCPQATIDNIIVGNTIEQIGPGQAGIYMVKPQGGSISSNSMDDTSGAYGILVSGAQVSATGAAGMSITDNTVSGKSVAAFEVAANSTYSAGTVAVSNGGSTVTITGGSFDNVPKVQSIRVGTDTIQYPVSAQTSTTLTLFSAYQGTGGSGLAYVVQGGVSSTVTLSSNSASTSPLGEVLQGCFSCSIVGGDVAAITTIAIVEQNTSWGNFISSAIAAVTLIDANSFAFRSNRTGLFINSGGGTGTLPTTPGSLRAVCISPSTGQMYMASSGSTC